jgi:iron complex outermembrane receptor protein
MIDREKKKKTKLAWLSFILLSALISELALADDPVRIEKKEEILVVASRIPVSLAEVGKDVIVIKKEDLGQLPIRTLSEALRYFALIDLQERGSFGVQADLSMRGSTFQQVLVMVDGVRVNDLQTAHHNLDLSIPLESVERIEILKGNGSSLFGADAFGGVINIVTKNSEKNNFSGRVAGYEYHTWSTAASLGIKQGKVSSLLSLERNVSDGFMADRDFDLFSVCQKMVFPLGKTQVETLLSHSEKDFGAYDFYTPGMNFPSRETTRATFLNLRLTRNIGENTLRQELYYRSHFDRFILDYTRPEFYANETKNHYLGYDLVFQGKGFSTGLEVVNEDYASLIGGQHSNWKLALFAEGRKVVLKKLIGNLGARLDYHQTYGFNFSPDLSLSYPVSSKFKIRASAGGSYRAPSYTELYYRDPVNFGNPSLKPEKGVSGEMGLETTISGVLRVEFALFQRKERDLIDWVKRDNKWQAENIRKRNVSGIEIILDASSSNLTLRLSGAGHWIREKSPEEIYKYGFRAPKYLVNLMVSYTPVKSLNIGLQVNHRQRFDETAYTLIDLRVIKKLGFFEVFIEGTNLTDVEYEDVKGVLMPGRWVGGGLQFGF